MHVIIQDLVNEVTESNDVVKGFKSMVAACPFISEGIPLLQQVREYNRTVLKTVNGDINAAKGKIDLFLERYLETYVNVRYFIYVHTNYIFFVHMICYL